MAFSTSNPVSVGDATKKTHYDNVFDNSVENVGSTYIADASPNNVAALDLVYMASGGKVRPADTSAAATAAVIGLATAAADNASVLVQNHGVLGGFSSLTVGATYYLDNVGAGAVTADISGFAATDRVIRIGVAVSATEILIDIDFDRESTTFLEDRTSDPSPLVEGTVYFRSDLDPPEWRCILDVASTPTKFTFDMTEV